VKPNGIIHLKTDSPFLYAYTTEMLRLNPYPILYTTDDLYAHIGDGEADKHALDASALQTHYEKQWLDRGLTIKYIKWQLTPLKEWSEPTIEIEKDSYRSYGRNYTVKAEP
jgi:tRNA (guanine-N7-)-methyltransferase